MNRRSFLRGLLALPLAPLAAKLLPRGEHAVLPPVAPAGILEGVTSCSGSDQTSIWMVDWRSPEELVAGFGSYDDFRVAEDDKFIAKFTEQLISNRNWLKESIRGN